MKTKYYIVTVQYPTGTGYIQVTEDTHGDDNIKFRLHSSRAHVSFTQNFGTAKRWAKAVADTLRRPTSVEDMDEAIRAGRKSHKKNPSRKEKPSRRERIKRLLLGRERQVGEAYRKTDFNSPAHKAAVLKYERALEGFQRTLPKGLRPKGMKAKRNPAPGPAERSAKFHRLRAKLLTQLQIAKRKGSLLLEQALGRKLLKLDRMFYAPRNIKRRK